MVERQNKTVAAMTRSFLKGAKLPSYLWGEAVRHSVYVLNRLSTRVLSGKTLYEAWTGDKPNLQHIKVFGCMVFMKIPQVHIKKLDNRSKAVVYLGKEPGTKANQLFDPASRTLHVSRDLVFEEEKTWAWEQKSTSEVVFPGEQITESHVVIPSPGPSLGHPPIGVNGSETDLHREELNSIEKNKTWILTDLHPGHKAIGLKWGFKAKKDTNGEVIKHKVRLVAKGYVQKQGVDFEEAFAPVTRLERNSSTTSCFIS